MPDDVTPFTGSEPVSLEARRTMQANRSRDTGPELAIRSILHSHGLRFRVDQPLPFNRRRRADITFSRACLYIFIDGCFWHGCPDHFVEPKTRKAFWRTKIHANRLRDLETTTQLKLSGATVLRIWEHEDPQVAAHHIISVYRSILERV